jgi:hypothetical protein
MKARESPLPQGFVDNEYQKMIPITRGASDRNRIRNQQVVGSNPTDCFMEINGFFSKSTGIWLLASIASGAASPIWERGAALT